MLPQFMRMSTSHAALFAGGSKYLFIFAGESNSGGYAPNADATGGELASRSSVQMWNVNTSVFENLDVGTNNNLDHSGLAVSTTHGWEIGLANAVEAGRFDHNSVFLVQTGQGGSLISEWATGHGSTYWTKMLARIQAAKAALVGSSYIPVVFYTQGINDAIDYSVYQVGLGNASTAGLEESGATWRTSTEAHFVKIRAELGATTLIVVPRFEASLTVRAGYNTQIDAIDAADAYTVAVASSGAGAHADGNHWSYSGYKLMAERLIDEVLRPVGGAASAPTISPAAGAYAVDQSATITAASGAVIRYTTNGSDPRIGTNYSGAFTAPVPGDVKAVARQTNGAWSSITTNTYTLLSATTFSTSDASAGSLTISNGDRTIVPTLSAWKTVRATTGKTSGKQYIEFKVAASAGNAFYMFGFASSGFAVSSYLGTSNYSMGLSPGTQYLSTGFTAGTGATPSGAPVLNDVWQLAIDFTGEKIWIGKNNAWLSSGDPAAGTNAAVTFVAATVGELFAAMSLYLDGGTWTMQSTSGQQTYSPPSGFSAWG